MNLALNPALLKICIALMIVLVVTGGIPARAMQIAESPPQNMVNAWENLPKEFFIVAMGIDRILADQENTTGTLPPAGIYGLRSPSASFEKMTIPLNGGNGPLSPPKNVC